MRDGTGVLAIDGIYGEVAGSGPPIVLTHDGLLHRESWDAQFETFAARYRVARWDRRGYGRSPRPTEPFSSVEDLAAVVRAISHSPATLVGCSFGSYYSLQCALDHPPLVAALVLVGPVITGLSLTDHFLTRGHREIPARDAPIDQQLAYWRETDPWIVAPTNNAARQRLYDLLVANPQNLRPPVELERRPAEPVLSRLGEISVPTLIVVGEQDIADVHAHAGAIEAGVLSAERVVLSGAGHLPQLEVPNAFNRIVIEFIADHQQSGVSTPPLADDHLHSSRQDHQVQQ
jgi:pimeloyl-ACP methyl ester carboxylesterase